MVLARRVRVAGGARPHAGGRIVYLPAGEFDIAGADAIGDQDLAVGQHGRGVIESQSYKGRGVGERSGRSRSNSNQMKPQRGQREGKGKGRGIVVLGVHSFGCARAAFFYRASFFRLPVSSLW